MKKSCRRGDELTVNALLNDLFAFQRDKKSMQNAVPWQWLLWSAFIFFSFGYLLPGDSAWVILAALAVAIIVYLARSSELVEPQVLLLTDDRSEEEKKNDKRTHRSYRRRYYNHRSKSNKAS